MAHVDLVTRAELPRFGIDAGFLAQFDVRGIQVTADTGGALGTATFKWRYVGDSTYSQVTLSSSVAPWSWSPADSFAVVTFATGTYTTTATYTIDEAGTVTRSGAGPDTVTATRYDVVADAIDSVTDRFTAAMQPRYTLPLTAWGNGVKSAVADWIKYELKSHVGMSSGENNVGDANVRLRYEDAQIYAKRLGAGPDKSPDITDSSTSGTGAGLMVAIESDDLAGW